MAASKGELYHPIPDGYISDDVFTVSDDLESYSPTQDPFLKYSQDPPALIACVTCLSHRT